MTTAAIARDIEQMSMRANIDLCMWAPFEFGCYIAPKGFLFLRWECGSRVTGEVSLTRFPLVRFPRLPGALFKSTKSNCCLRLPRSTTASDANGSQPGSHSFKEVLLRTHYGFYGAAEISGSLSKPIPEVVTEKGEGRSPSSRVGRSAIRDRCQEIRRKRAECSLR